MSLNKELKNKILLLLRYFFNLKAMLPKTIQIKDNWITSISTSKTFYRNCILFEEDNAFDYKTLIRFS